MSPAKEYVEVEILLSQSREEITNLCKCMKTEDCKVAPIDPISTQIKVAKATGVSKN